MTSAPIPVRPAPLLAPPGAGLPGYELTIGRVMFAWRRLTTSRAQTEAAILAERGAILGLIRDFNLARGAERVVIPRPRGLEDSSRHWSVFMTFEHLHIVNRQIAATVRELLAGRIPAHVASTANVKPSVSAGASALVEFERSCDELTAAGADAPTLRTPQRYAHPWFGPLNAADWKLMAAVHLGLHRAQLAQILARLARDQ